MNFIQLPQRRPSDSATPEPHRRRRNQEGEEGTQDEDHQEEEPRVKKLIRQFDNRLRLLEHQNLVVAFFPAEHVAVKEGLRMRKEYDKTCKEQGNNHTQGPPELHLGFNLLSELGRWLDAATENVPLHFKGVPQRLMLMARKNSPEELSLWMTECCWSNTFDRDVKRLTVEMHGEILVAGEVRAAEQLQGEQEEAFAGDIATSCRRHLSKFRPTTCTPNIAKS